jgi:enoyl-CoA hydratase/carnithine racemase
MEFSLLHFEKRPPVAVIAIDNPKTVKALNAETMRAVDEGLDHPLDLGLMREAVRFGHLCGTADMKEGTAAFLEKRKAAWHGR